MADTVIGDREDGHKMSFMTDNSGRTYCVYCKESCTYDREMSDACPQAPLKTWTVIGIYEDDDQQWADSYSGRSLNEIKSMVPDEIIIAGIVEGNHLVY